MTNWTKGPWRVLNGKYGLQVHSGKHWLANIKCESCPAHEEANAQIIAAAPELYEALAECEAWIRRYHNDDRPDLAEKASAALSKARGEAQ